MAKIFFGKNNSNKQIQRFSPSFNEGLSSEQVKQREEERLLNFTKQKTSKSYLKIIFNNTFTFFNLIWLIIFIALICVKSYTNLLFAIVIVMNTGIAIFQEIRSKRIVEKLSVITAPKIKVVRNGQEIEISSDKIVLDDVIVLSIGNQIPTDSIVISGSVEVNESLLTGESKPIKKLPNSELFAGSFVTSGKCYALAIKIGKQSYIQNVASEAKKFKQPTSNLFKDLNKIIRYIGIFIIPIGALTFINCYIWSGSYNLTKAIENTCGSLTGMIPTGMFLLISVALAVGVVKLANKKTLVQNLYSIEMLARSNILCLDKTGTITDGTMTVKEIKAFESNQDEIKKIVSAILSAQSTENSTSKALVNFFGKECKEKVEVNIPFSSDRKFTATSFKSGTYVIGASEYVKAKQSKELKKAIENGTKKGLRVLVVAKSKNKILNEKIPDDLLAIGIIFIEDTIRPDAIETIKWFKQNEVQIKIISGDDPSTVSTIAKRVGVENAEKYINLEGMTLEEVSTIADKYTVFGRVSPEQKHTIIKKLKEKNVVAMTGDGVNDTLALKEADCSIAMADGSAVARNISHLVLLDSKFSSLPMVVEEGRRVINNVQKSSTLFLMKTVMVIFLSIICLITQINYFFEPKNMFLLEFFVIGMPSFFLALQPNKNLIRGNFIPYVLKKSLPYGIMILVNVMVPVLLREYGLILPSQMITVATVSMTICGLLNLISLCNPMSKLKFFVIIGSTLAITLSGIFLYDFFGLYDFSSVSLRLILILFLATALLQNISKIIYILFMRRKKYEN